ncbi:MAG TPA: DUF4136 domain-containing protein [Candidatus Acidoferrales bacterium]|nr:DUF4136 domain-containing protein [Candidatus Acidoferrales bacterium]
MRVKSMKMRVATLVAFCALFCALTCGLALAPAFAQKVDVTVDQNAHFKKYKRYAWGKNSLVTRQTADVEAQIEQKIEAAANFQLTTKGFVLDAAQPDFVIHYDAGAMPDPGASAATWQQPIAGGDYIGGTFAGVPMDVWLQVTGVIKFAVQDTKSQTVVWQSVLTKKTNEPKKFMKNLDSEINKLVAKSLQKFPPK